jgi:ubiquinone/menaquinone biosynthesis C-methylase UbiE
MLKNMATKNVEFRQGDIEKRIPVEDNGVDFVTSDCAINPGSNKVNAFKDVHRILEQTGDGKMVASDLVAEKEIVDADGLRDLTDYLHCQKPFLFP